MSDDPSGTPSLIVMSAEIVAAYVSNNSMSASELPALIQSVFDSIARASSPAQPIVEAPQQEPAVAIKKSVTPDYIISLETGRKFKSLKRYLMTSHQMTPQQYREKWRLPHDYPMVAPNYAKARSALAKSSGLGGRAKADKVSKIRRKPKGAPAS